MSHHSTLLMRGPRRNRLMAAVLIPVVFASLVVVLLQATSKPAAAATYTLTKAAYRDKTLAGILGQIGGVLTGYEYLSPNPVSAAMESTCFQVAGGPYSGDAPAACWTPNGYPGYDRLGAPNFASNEVGSDDDYHVDFLDELILDQYGPSLSYQDIKDAWTYHNVGDWGPGDIANSLMRNEGLLPPLTGQAEYDRHYWLTEPYIENDTVGMAAPGMPATARDLTGTFASVTGEFDSVIWAKFLGTMYSMAYTATDVRAVLADASVVLPRNSWPYLVYKKANALHDQYPTDWRAAQGQLLAYVRNVYGQDNVQAIPDRNNGATILAILYGNNDYLTSLKIASLIGNDADCTASAVAGLFGVVKGMAGTPQEFKDKIYQSGAGRYINDLVTGYPPNIGNDYPTAQSFDDIVSLYQANAEDQIVANGGAVNTNDYTIVTQTVLPEKVVQVNNADFEQGTLSGWSTWTPSGTAPSGNAYAANDTTTSQSGAWKGTVVTDATTTQVKLFATLRGLTAGATYRVSAFLETDQFARLYLDNYGGAARYASVVDTDAEHNRLWAERTIEFTAVNSTADVGLWMPPGAAGASSIDNLTVTQIVKPTTTRYEAEAATRSSIAGGGAQSSASASGGQYVGGIDDGGFLQFTVTAPAAGQYRAAINYANATTDTAKMDLIVNNVNVAAAPFPRTEAWGTFSANLLSVPVSLRAGSNTIKLKLTADTGYVEFDYLDVSTYPQPAYAAESANLITNPGFESDPATQAPSAWTTWPGTAGTDADADYTETGGSFGAMRGTHYKASTYEVYTSQVVTGLANGTYTLTADVVGNGGQIAAFMSAKNYGASVPELTASIPSLGYPNWRRVVISGIVVTNNQVQVGFYSNSPGGRFISFDDVQLSIQ